MKLATTETSTNTDTPMTTAYIKSFLSGSEGGSVEATNITLSFFIAIIRHWKSFA